MSTTVAYDYKYTDRDVREDPRLAELACAYLKTYGGDFEPLLEAKTYLRVVGEPPAAMIRRTLNCMRHDHSVAGQMPTPQRPSFAIEDVQMPDTIFIKGRKQKVHKVVRYPYDLKVNWKKRYYAATAPRSTSFHHLSTEASVIRYWPAVGEYKALLKAYCGVSLATGVLLDAPPDNRHECNQCVRMMYEQACREEQRMTEAARLRGES